MQLSHCECIYTHCAVNCYPHCLDFKHELICFATHNSIAFYDLKQCKIVGLCSRHSDVINSVRWIGKYDQYLISASADKTCIIWEKTEKYLYQPKFILSGHTDSVIVSDSLCQSSKEETYFVSASSSNEQILRFWKNDILLLSQNVNSFIFDLKLYQNLIIPGIIILTAGSNELVNIGRFNEDTNELESLISLKGHGDWIKALDLYQLENDTIMLASGSQDFFIRVYSIKASQEDVNLHQQMFALTQEGKQLSFVVNLETVLSGHEGWVTDVKWHFSDKLYLLSSSMDKTIVLWEQMGDVDSIWNEKIRLGEVGGNAIGFIGCCSLASLGMIAGYSFNGAVNFWKQTESGQWQTSLPITGHFKEVTDLIWEPQGDYFLTCSVDQTTRLHSYWRHDDRNTWHEISRPQVHGYDLKCLAMAGRFKFISGADEKVIRIFNSTRNFIESLGQITAKEQTPSVTEGGDQLAECAVVPALGLSNSAVYDSAQMGDECKTQVFSTPPTEEILLQSTLWPESQKLYGHGYEIFAIAVNRQCTLLASSCKAANMNHAAIILWDLKSCKKLTSLSSHNLTVTQLRFSPDDQYLLSVSRDRTWALFDMNDSEYRRIGFSDKKTAVHSRIIWDCAWTPDCKAFLTAARDKTVVVWRLTQNDLSLPQINSSKQLTLQDSVTSIDVHEHYTTPYLSCVAQDNGQILLYSFTLADDWTLLYSIDNSHTLTVNRVRFSPKIDEDIEDKKKATVLLASCSNDRSVRLFQLGLITV